MRLYHTWATLQENLSLLDGTIRGADSFPIHSLDSMIVVYMPNLNILARPFYNLTMCGSRKVCQRKSNFDSLRRENFQLPLKAGHHRPTSETPLKCHSLNAALVALSIFRATGPILLRNPIALWLSRGSRPGRPSGSTHDDILKLCITD